jgi:hypothetical protein
MTHEIPRSQWAEALTAFSRDHRAWLARVEHEGAPPVAQRDRPLAGIVPERSGSRVIAIRIDFAADVSRDTSVRIEVPVKVELETSHDGTPSGMEIQDVTGRRTRLRFRVTPPVEILDGIAPAEM